MMIYRDGNRVLPDHAQPLGGPLRARKVLLLPTDSGGGRAGSLYLLARRLAGPVDRLAAAVNGQAVSVESPKRTGAFGWYRAAVPASFLRAGANQVEIAAPGAGPGDWRLALSAGGEGRDSVLSRDGGKTWSPRDLGRFAALDGEWLVRLRLAGGAPTPPPPFLEEPFDHPELERIRAFLPGRLSAGGDTLTRAGRVSTWVARRLFYLNSAPADLYTPWNFWEIMRADGENRRARAAGQRPRHVVMCVHFAVVMVQALLALGVRARCAVSTWALDSGLGHFFPEVWLPEEARWVVVDPTGDFLFRDGAGRVLGAAGLYPNRGRLREMIRFGPGVKSQGQLRSFFEGSVLTGKCYRNLGYWRRNDFFSRPEQAPGSHGTICYCEPDIVWTHGSDDRLPAFPHDCRNRARPGGRPVNANQPG